MSPALAAFIGRKKYGPKRFAHLAEAAKKGVEDATEAFEKFNPNHDEKGRFSSGPGGGGAGGKKPYDVVGGIMAHESGQLDEEGTRQLFQHLKDTGMINHLQGSYGRQAAAMLANGDISNNTAPVADGAMAAKHAYYVVRGGKRELPAFHTQDNKIVSYGTTLAQFEPDATHVNTTKYSVTTSKHQNRLAMGIAATHDVGSGPGGIAPVKRYSNVPMGTRDLAAHAARGGT